MYTKQEIGKEGSNRPKNISKRREKRVRFQNGLFIQSKRKRKKKKKEEKNFRKKRVAGKEKMENGSRVIENLEGGIIKLLGHAVVFEGFGPSDKK